MGKSEPVKQLKLSQKYKDFIRSPYFFEVMEGTTSSGKTVTATNLKFMMKVINSDKDQHILAGKSIGVLEKNIIHSDYGILYFWNGMVEYKGKGSSEYKMPHLVVHIPDKKDKIIFLVGYSDRKRWENIRGSQFGCAFIDEANLANLDFLQEITMRCSTWICMTLNPDDPSKDIYPNFINSCSPVKKYKKDIPLEILKYFSDKPKKNHKYWFFSFKDNLGISEERVQQIKDSNQEGTKRYNNLVLGLRCRAEGLCFPNFGASSLISEEQILNLKFKYFMSGLDTSYSVKTDDTIAMTFLGITEDGKLIYLDEKVLSNKNNPNPFSPSDVVKEYIKFLDDCVKRYSVGNRFKGCYIDEADSATYIEFKKYKKEHREIRYILNKSAKNELQIKDRIWLQVGWIKSGHYLVNEKCKEHIHEMENYSWHEDKIETPEDKNDHTINSQQYAFIPFRFRIGLAK